MGDYVFYGPIWGDLKNVEGIEVLSRGHVRQESKGKPKTSGCPPSALQRGVVIGL